MWTEDIGARQESAARQNLFDNAILRASATNQHLITDGDSVGKASLSGMNGTANVTQPNFAGYRDTAKCACDCDNFSFHQVCLLLGRAILVWSQSRLLCS